MKYIYFIIFTIPIITFLTVISVFNSIEVSKEYPQTLGISSGINAFVPTSTNATGESIFAFVNTTGRDIYIQGNATITDSLNLGSITGECLETDENGLVVGSGSACGSGSGGGSGGSVATSSSEVSGQVPFFTSNGATPATIGGDAGFTFDSGTDILHVLGGVSTTNSTSSGWLNVGITDVVGTLGALIGAGDLYVGNNATITNNLDVNGTIFGDLTGNADTATALAANGTNASAGNAILGVDASGNAEGAFDVWTEAENTAAGYGISNWIFTDYLTPSTTAGLIVNASSTYIGDFTANNLFVQASTNRVGIGTTTPQATLSIVDTAGNLNNLLQVASSTSADDIDVLRVTADQTVVIGDDDGQGDSAVGLGVIDGLSQYSFGYQTTTQLFNIASGGVLGSNSIFSANSAGSTIHGNATTSEWLNVGTTDVVSTYGSSIGTGDLHVGRNATVTNSFSSESVIIKGDADPSTQLSVERDNDGTGGATVSLFHDTASPATSDAVGNILFHESRTSAQATKVEYGRITVLPTTVTSGSEAGQMQFWTANAGTSASRMSILGNGSVGIGPTTPAARLDVDSESNTAGIRLRGLAESAEILDIYMGSAGQALFDLRNGSDTGQFFSLLPEDDQFGVTFWESDGTGLGAYGNLYVTEATSDDTLNLTVTKAQSASSGITIDENDNLGIRKNPSHPFDVSDGTNDLFGVIDSGTWGTATTGAMVISNNNFGGITQGKGDLFVGGNATTTNLFLPTGGVIGWGNSNVSITHSNQVLTIDGGTAMTHSVAAENSYIDSYADDESTYIDVVDGGVGGSVSLNAWNGTIVVKASTANTFGIQNFSNITGSNKTFDYPNVTGNICVDTASNNFTAYNFFTAGVHLGNASSSDLTVNGNATTTGWFNVGTTDVVGTLGSLMGAGDLFAGGNATTSGTHDIAGGLRVYKSGSTTTLEFY